MSRIVCRLEMELLSDTIFSSGNSIPGGEDISLRIDQDQRPILPGATIKGLLRENLGNYLCWQDQPAETMLETLFGTEGRTSSDFSRRVIPGDLHLEGTYSSESDYSGIRMFTALEDGIVKTGTLRMSACLNSGLRFAGILLCSEDDFSLLSEGIKTIRWAGLMRNRGFGNVRFHLEKQYDVNPCKPIGHSSILHYRLKLETPLTASWLSRSGTGLTDDRNYTECRKYLPGSAVRGMVLSELAQTRPAWFQENKRALLKEITFLNALPMNGDVSQIPLPAGFYCDKAATRFYSVLTQDVLPGDKRVSEGAFCAIEAGKIKPYSPQMLSSLRIQKEKREMFTTRMIAAGTVLEGYILLNNPAFSADISSAFPEYLTIGADRGTGSGLCHVEFMDTSLPEFWKYSYQKQDAIPQTLYMMMMSPGTMMRFGEPIGLDEAQLSSLLGVDSVAITACSTSITESFGYNSTIGEKEPVVTMYEMGSVFCISCSSSPKYEKLHALEQQGIGIRREEGYGQVLFLKDYRGISGIAEKSNGVKEKSESAELRRNRCSWLLGNEFPRKFTYHGRKREEIAELSNSQIGRLQALCEFVLNNDQLNEAGKRSEIEKFFDHNIGRNDPKYQAGFRMLKKKLFDIWNGKEETVTVFAKSFQERLQLTCDWMNLSRKEQSK